MHIFMAGHTFPLRTQGASWPGLAVDIYLQPSSEEAAGDSGRCFQCHLHLQLNHEHPGGQERFAGWVQGPHGEDHRVLQKGKGIWWNWRHNRGSLPFVGKALSMHTTRNGENPPVRGRAAELLPMLSGCPLAWLQGPGRRVGHLSTHRGPGRLHKEPFARAAGARPLTEETSQPGLSGPAQPLPRTGHQWAGRCGAEGDFFLS